MSEQEKNLLDVEVEDGKYRVVMSETGHFRAYRHGELWRELTGDKLIFALASELDEAKKCIKILLEKPV